MTTPAETLTVPRFARAHDYAGAWAVEPGVGRHLWGRARATDLAAHVRATQERRAAAAEPRPRTQYTTPVAVSPTQTVAVIRMSGLLMKAEMSMEESTSTIQLRREIRAAAGDAAVSAIVLSIDSPGGTVAGTDDLAAEVKAAAKAKPVLAHVDDLCASAAYWVASQCESIHANSATALVGSIGTLLVVYDLSKSAAEEGVEALVFATGPIKGAGTPGAPVSEDQREYFQQLVDAAQGSFDAAVRAGRGLTAKQLDAVRTGGVFPVSAAVGLGLADGVKSLDATIAAAAAAARSAAKAGPKSRSTTPTPAARAADHPRPAERPMPDTELDAGGTPAPAPAPAPTPAATSGVAEEIRRQAAAELRQVAAIRSLCGPDHATAAEAIEQGWSLERTELAVLRKGRGAGVPAGAPGAIVRGNPLADHRVFEAALCLRAGVPAERLERSYGRERLDAADNREVRSSANLSALLAHTINAAGGHAGYGSVTDDVIRQAFRADRQLRASDGAASTYSLTGILSNVANKLLMMSFMAVDQAVLKVASATDVNDFKQVSRFRLTAAGLFEKVGPSGEIKHGGLSEEKFTNQADTYAKMMVLTRTDIVNDDLGALGNVTKLLGRNAVLTLLRALALQILNAGTFFSTANKNKLTGAASALSINGLTKAVQKFMELSDANGPIMIAPRYVLVPPALSVYGTQVTTQASCNEAPASEPKPANNPHAGKYEAIAFPHLGTNAGLKNDDGTAVTGSDTGWYVFGDPADVPALDVAYLRGQRSPIFDSAETDLDTLGMKMRGYFDFGVNRQDPKGAQQNVGA